MTVLLLKGYNNYFNRIHKQEESITDYKARSTTYLEYQNVNFDMQDGILTSLIVGNEAQQDQNTGEIIQFDSLGSPDYLIVHDGTNIKSRWFVVECVKIRGGQYKLALKRDVLADFNSQVMQSPCFIEKGSITDVSSPLLRNSEGMVFNQIKQSEDFIKDDSKCAWLVGYIKKGIDATDLQSVNPITYTDSIYTANIPDAGSYEWEPCIQYVDSTGANVNSSPKSCFWLYGSNTSFRTYYQLMGTNRNVRTTMSSDYNIVYSETDQSNVDWKGLTYSAFDVTPGVQALADTAKALANLVVYTTRDNEAVRTAYDTMIDYAKYQQFGANSTVISEDIAKYNNTRIVKDNKVYRLEITMGTAATFAQRMSCMDTQVAAWLSDVAAQVAGITYVTTSPTSPRVCIEFSGKTFQIIAREEPISETVSLNLPVSSARNECTDATYDMFAMPVDPKALGLTVSSENVVISYKDGSNNIQAADLSNMSDTQLAMAMELCTKLGAGSDASLVYDLQLLPYCPFRGLNAYFDTRYGPTYGRYVIDTTTLESEDFSIIWNSEATPAARGILFYPQKANFSVGIDYSMPNETVHYEPQKVVNPTFVYNNTTWQGRPQYIFLDWPYECTDGVYDLDQNTLKLEAQGIRPAYLEAHVSTGAKKPMIVLTSDDLPTSPTPSQEVTLDGYVEVAAHWILPDKPEDVKVQNECDLYRLASPNYNAIYEFKKTKLKGGIRSFNIDCTYKPFTPYIKVNPNYDESFYASQDFNDSMGLICNGDFSIPMLSDAWVNYELQNRNYQAIFNRQIQNLDVNNQIAKEKQQFADTLGVITAGVTGVAGAGLAAASGRYVGAAAAAGGLPAGMAVAEIRREKDQDWLERQQSEARSFAVDNFQYQLGNTQALNPTITKSTPLTYNNKVWPILEKFSCTETEKDLLREKIKYDGMTVMAIGRLIDYSAAGCHLKGKLIRLEGLEDDSHIAQAIYEEVDKGFYEGE